jgi:hypothetical protein
MSLYASNGRTFFKKTTIFFEKTQLQEFPLAIHYSIMTDAKVDPILAEDEEDLALERQAFEQGQARQQRLAAERERLRWRRGSGQRRRYFWLIIANRVYFFSVTLPLSLTFSIAPRRNKWKQRPST